MKINIVTTLLLITACNCFAQQITFQKTIAPFSLDPYNCSVKQTADGGYIIFSYTDLAISIVDYVVSLIKTDANGDTLWIKKFYNGTATSVQQTSDGGYIVVGGYNNSGEGYLIKTDGNGDTLWIKTYGGTNTDFFHSGLQTADGGFIMGGNTNSFGTGNVGYLVKTDANGDLLWSKTYSNAGNFIVQQTTDGGYILTGLSYFTGMPYYLLSLTKTDSSGNLSWIKTYDGSGSSIGYAVQQTSDGGLIAIGTVGQSPNSDILLIKTDSAGNLLWSKIISGGNYDYGRYVQQTSDGGYIIGGATNGFSSLIKTDVSGNLVWSWSFNGPVSGLVKCVRQTSDGGYILICDDVLVKTDSLGNSGCNQFNTVLSISTPAIVVNSPAITVAAVSTIVNSFATGIGSGATVTTLCTTVGVENIEIESKLLVYPNPSDGSVNIQLSNVGYDDLKISVIDLLGRNVFESVFKNPGELFMRSLDLSSLLKGIYVLKIESKNLSHSEKLVLK